MDIGGRITYFRKQKGITVNKLANISGISQSYLRDIELGKKQPTIEYLGYICDALDITFLTFFDDNSELETAICKLNDKQKKALIDFIDTLLDGK